MPPRWQLDMLPRLEQVFFVERRRLSIDRRRIVGQLA
jgi:hypothetical protein